MKLGHPYINKSISHYGPKRQLFIFFESTNVVYSSYVVQEEFSMSTLLHLDSSPLYGRSVSRELTAAFVTQWKAAHPDGKVIDRGLNATAMPPINAEWVGAVYTPERARTPEQKELLPLSTR